jgi:superfamily I DNA/RNA helicase
MAYLRLAVGLRDNIALSRIINTPRRGIGDSSLIRLQAAAAERGLTLCSLLFGDGFSGEGGQGSDQGSQGSGEGTQGGQGSDEASQGSGEGSDGSEGAEGGEGRGMQLPPLPDRKELGLPAKAATALEAFRQLMAELHVAVRTQPLHKALKHIVDRVGGRQLGLRRYSCLLSRLGSGLPGWLPAFLPSCLPCLLYSACLLARCNWCYPILLVIPRARSLGPHPL